MDLGIIIDSSASIPAKEFETAKEFVATLVRPLPVSPTQTRVGLMTYNAYATVILRFSNKMYQNVAAVERIINSIRSVTWLKIKLIFVSIVNFLGTNPNWQELIKLVIVVLFQYTF